VVFLGGCCSYGIVNYGYLICGYRSCARFI
jgi:hypothetical protein